MRIASKNNVLKLVRDFGNLDEVGNVKIDKIAKTLRKLRDAAKMSQKELSARAGVAHKTLQDLESSKGNPTIDTLEALANTLGVSILEILGEALKPAKTFDVSFAAQLLAGLDKLRPIRRAAVLYLIFQDKAFLATISERDAQELQSALKAL